jgi:hypothetical protein
MINIDYLIDNSFFASLKNNKETNITAVLIMSSVSRFRNFIAPGLSKLSLLRGTIYFNLFLFIEPVSYGFPIT